MGKLYWTDEKRELRDLIPWEKNPRQINKDQAQRLRQSYRDFGQALPFLISPKNEIYDGHQRQNVWGLMDDFGMDHQVDVRVSSRKLTEKERQRLTIFLEKAGGEWDYDALGNYFEQDDLLDWGFDEEELEFAFEDDEVPEIPSDPGADVDKVHDLLVKWEVVAGQVWKLGDHKIMAGDCTKPDDVDLLLQGEKVRLCVTSPPYYNQRSYSEWPTFEDYMAFTRSSFEQIIRTADTHFALCWNIGDQCASEETRDIPGYHSILLQDMGLKYRDKIIWRKAGAVFDIPRSMHIENGRYFPALGHETILVYTKKHPSFEKRDKKIVREWQINVWDMRQVMTNNQNDNEGHPAQFPVDLPERCVYSYTKKGAIVFEPFCGSGTTLVVYEQLGRSCRAMEIDPGYVAVTLERWHRMTGKNPEILQIQDNGKSTESTVPKKKKKEVKK